MDAVCSISVSECGQRGCTGFEWAVDFGLAFDPFHGCDKVMPSAIERTIRELTGYTLEQFRLLAFTYDTDEFSSEPIHPGEVDAPWLK